VYLAYQVAGGGPIDIVWQPDWPGNLDMEWEFRVVRTYLDAFSSFGRLILHDHRGVGLSSRNVAIPNLETRVADVVIVLDAAEASRPALVGWGPLPPYMPCSRALGRT
jgi:pimeloyl-ACP methyl ester carboxylesterase